MTAMGLYEPKQSIKAPWAQPLPVDALPCLMPSFMLVCERMCKSPHNSVPWTFSCHAQNTQGQGPFAEESFALKLH